ncbi:type II toxin-antitoxin system Phd/YefM family antitoxin [Pseudaestuariivita atlantica]|uniref:Antitoxin n=1 Tax=Pseudaestuariivita atlantica TaxID=1317121 RepID=A0A0L1JU31_9RHOB|nr:type II toxin-antitoxin system Phd/YefM family antitoxin [Pseudaestuariivita atlantica]KNG95197.1 hypothetical protein ATO11_00700 [Pseudaestuariivita atlantica]
MTLAPYQIVPLTDFRRDCSRWTGWVRSEGGRVWISRHGRCEAALVPMFQCERLEKFERRSLADERARIEACYARWKRAMTDEDGFTPFEWGEFGKGTEW